MPAKTIFVPGIPFLGILDVFLEGRLIPDDARILVGIGILVIRDATGLAAIQAILCRTDLVLRARTDAMADQTFLKRDFALGDVSAIPASVDVAISATATISVFVIMRRFPLVPARRSATSATLHSAANLTRSRSSGAGAACQPPIGRAAAVLLAAYFN